MNTFMDYLSRYLELRDQQNSDYYDNRVISSRYCDYEEMMKISKILDDSIKVIIKDD
jgi:hypothetical protein